MLTLISLLNKLCDSDKIHFEGEHYESGDMVYVGDLWRIWPSIDGSNLESRKQNRLRRLMEQKGLQLRFEDETITDDDGMVHEAQQQCYGDVMTWCIIDCSIWSRSEAEKNPENYMLSLLAAETITPDKWDIDFKPFGFVKFDYEAEAGFHPGQTDTPAKLESLNEKEYGECDIIFSIDYMGQFDIGFSAWYRKQEEN